MTCCCEVLIMILRRLVAAKIRYIMLQFKNNSKDNTHKILRKIIMKLLAYKRLIRSKTLDLQCVLDFVNDVNVPSKSKSAKSSEKKKTWKPTVPLKETTSKSVTTPNLDLRSESSILGSRPSNISKPKKHWGSTVSNFPSSSLVNFSKFMGTVRLGNDHVAKVMGYGDYQLGNVTISRVYYVEGLGNNLFSVSQFCDSDLEVTFRKHTCHICDLQGVDLHKGSRGSNLYMLSLEDMMLSSPICLLSKASKTKS
ncbi:hypothetical protein Tco_1443889 [Tanacetum coccineum]